MRYLAYRMVRYDSLPDVSGPPLWHSLGDLRPQFAGCAQRRSVLTARHQRYVCHPCITYRRSTQTPGDLAFFVLQRFSGATPMRIKSWWVSPCRWLRDTAGVSWEPWKFATDSRDGADILREQRHQYQRADRGGSRLGECARQGQMRIAHLALGRARG